MRKSILLFLFLMMISGTALAREEVRMERPYSSSPTQLKSSKKVDIGGLSMSQGARVLHSIADFKAVKTTIKAPKVGTKIKRKSITTIKDLEGSYVMSYKSLSDAGDGGKNAHIVPIEGTDSILIQNFWDAGVNVKAKVNLALGTINIPNQKVGTSATYGDFEIAKSANNGAPIRTEELVATISPDGVISLDDWWGMYISEGTNKDKFFGVCGTTELEKTNATMSISTLGSDKVAIFGVIFTQPAKNVVKVKNFANYGKTIEIVLNRDSTAVMTTQAARSDGSTNGDWMTVTVGYDSIGTLKSYDGTINLEKATDNLSLKWKDWSLLNMTVKKYLGILVEGRIDVTTPIEYPALSVSDFEGTGTKEDPYLIKQLDHLLLLSDKVNNDTELNYTNGYSNYARPFLGKYFKLANDIDMDGYRFEPIGHDWQHIFAGNFDGNNHTITNLMVSTEAGYAGLFGRCDTLSVISNMVLASPTVETNGNYAGALAAWSLGSIKNIKVTNPSVINNKQCAGGVAGIGFNIDNCQVVSGVVGSQGGYVGGITGELDGSMSSCEVSNTRILAGGASASTPSGGVVGSAYIGHISDCYYAGNIAGNYASDLYIGGIAGVLYQGSIKNSFSTGSILATGTNTAVGGIAGGVYGSITDCYSTSTVTSVGSRRAGGICGLVNNYETLDGDTLESVIKNCFTAGQVYAETYQYNPEVEVRETLGTINTGAKPEVENVYFDKQIINLTSKKYGATTAQLTSATGIQGFDSSLWSFSEGFYPMLKKFVATKDAQLASSAIVMAEGSNYNKLSSNATLNAGTGVNFRLLKQTQAVTEGYNCNVVGNQLQIGTTFGNDTLAIIGTSGAYRTMLLKIAPIPFSGQGTIEDPFLIKTSDDLIALSKVTTVAKQYFPDTYFKMTNDIDLGYSSEFIGICTDVDDAHCQFAGHFDGGGFTIHKMKLTGVAWTKAPTDTELGTPNVDGCKGILGFIGRLGVQGTLSNLSIAADADLQYWGQSAALCGYCYGKIDNCKNYADVTGYSCWIGGIAGQTTVESQITNCYNAGNIVSGYMQAGGICGTAYGVVENCMNTGFVSVEYISTFSTATKLTSAGGIAGNANTALISNVVNAGVVKAYSKAGGITGSLGLVSQTSAKHFNDLNNAINYGTVVSELKDLRGAVAGATGTKGAVADNYWDAQIIAMPAAGNSDLEGVTGVETSVLTSGTPLKNYSTDLWSFEAGKYPVLKQFANEEQVKVLRSSVINIPTGVTAEDLSTDVTLPNNLAWRLRQSKVFSLDGNKLVVPTTVEKVECDSLIGLDETTNSVKLVLLSRYPAIPLTGEGTEANPYKITNVTDWNALSDFLSATSHSFEGEFLEVTSDIDFANSTFKMLAGDGITFFNGTLLGNNYTLKNISYTATATYQGALGIIGAKGLVKGLKLQGTMTAPFANVGAFAGKVFGKLQNCTNQISIESTKGNVAGFAALACAGSVFEGCVNEGSVTCSSTYVAGIAAATEEGVEFINTGNKGAIKYTGTSSNAYIAGLVANSYSCKFNGCYNEGEVIVGTPTSTGTIAGLVANSRSKTGSPRYEYINCYNTADITGKAVVGGLTAAVDTYTQVYATGCYNEGDVVAASTSAVSSSPTAGLFTFYCPNSYYENCFNTGTVISQKNVYTGGVFGYYKQAPNAANPTVVKKCYNTGDIIAAGNQGGGIFGYCNNYMTVDSCYNEGPISGGFGLGGIAGCLYGAFSTMTNCWNAGDISTSTNRAGGIVGYTNTKSVVTDCYNIGNISTSSTTQGVTSTSGYGIGGVAGQGGASFTNCYNVGKVTGVSQVGGLIGVPVKNYTTLTNCYNAGNIIAPADTCGALVGVDMTNGKLWTEQNVVTNSYYVTDFGTYKNVVGTAKTLAELAKTDMGEGWVAGDNYSLPILASSANENSAFVGAAVVIVADGDSYDSVTKDFFVGAPERVVWTASIPNVSVKGNNATFTAEAYVGKLVMTVTDIDGDFTKTIELTVNKPSGVSGTTMSKEVVEETYYTVSGVKVPKPEAKDGSIYVVVKVYDDGSKSVEKTIDK